MPADWLQITLESERPLDVERILQGCGAVSVTILDAADDPLYEPLPGETPMWKISRITGLFSTDADSDAILSVVTRELGLYRPPPHEIETLEDQDWTRAWLSDFQPMRFGQRLWVCPGEQQVEDKDAVILRLDPGLAFGTGTHPTTAMCLEWLDGHPPVGQTVVDYGCGSGILGIAAALLGAASVHACDIDPQAITSTRDNAERNGSLATLRTSPAGRSPDLHNADLVLANILSSALIQLHDDLTRLLRPGGRILLTGILEEQVDAVVTAYAGQHRLDGHLSRGDWHCLVMEKS